MGTGFRRVVRWRPNPVFFFRFCCVRRRPLAVFCVVLLLLSSARWPRSSAAAPRPNPSTTHLAPYPYAPSNPACSSPPLLYAIAPIIFHEKCRYQIQVFFFECLRKIGALPKDR